MSTDSLPRKTLSEFRSAWQHYRQHGKKLARQYLSYARDKVLRSRYSSAATVLEQRELSWGRPFVDHLKPRETSCAIQTIGNAEVHACRSRTDGFFCFRSPQKVRPARFFPRRSPVMRSTLTRRRPQQHFYDNGSLSFSCDGISLLGSNTTQQQKRVARNGILCGKAAVTILSARRVN